MKELWLKSIRSLGEPDISPEKMCGDQTIKISPESYRKDLATQEGETQVGHRFRGRGWIVCYRVVKIHIQIYQRDDVATLLIAMLCILKSNLHSLLLASVHVFIQILRSI